MQQAFVNLRSGRPTQLPPPVEGYLERIGPQERGILEQVLSCASIGTPEMVRSDLSAFVERTGADELMITCQIFDHAARLRSVEIAAQVLSS
jgi:alkanesulfonate monooxygenase SsuD/methylene tetrahydromethanopterin reductase-like flavin-dependent oxidoreductase (luciferase family)